MGTIIVVQILPNAIHCAIFSCQTLCFKNNFGSFNLSSKVKTNMKEMLNRLKRIFKNLYK